MQPFEAFRFSALSVVMYGGACLLALGQVLTVLKAGKRLSDEEIAGRYRLSTMLAVVTCLFVLFILALSVLSEEIGFSSAMVIKADYRSDIRVVFIPAALGKLAYVHARAGVVLTAAGILGILCVGMVWLRHRRRETISPIPFLGITGVGLVAAAIGSMWAVREFMLGRVLSDINYACTGEVRSLFSLALQGAPSMSTGLYISFIVMLTVVTALILVVRKRNLSLIARGCLLPLGLMVLILGAISLFSTCGHARDAGERLQALVGGPYDDLASTKCKRGEILYRVKNIELPELDGGWPLELAPVVEMSGEGVVFEGKKVAFIGEKEEQAGVLPDLVESLLELKKNYKLLHPKRELPGKIIFQADVKTPGRVLSRVLSSCRAAGYGHAVLAFRKAEVFETSVYGALLRFEHVGVPLAPGRTDDPAALMPDETLQQWLLRSDASGDTKIVIARQREDAGSEDETR